MKEKVNLFAKIHGYAISREHAKIFLRKSGYPAISGKTYSILVREYNM
jgi:hypothetical protein